MNTNLGVNAAHICTSVATAVGVCGALFSLPLNGGEPGMTWAAVGLVSAAGWAWLVIMGDNLPKPASMIFAISAFVHALIAATLVILQGAVLGLMLIFAIAGNTPQLGVGLPLLICNCATLAVLMAVFIVVCAGR